jgi:transducin (beta)-like 1
LEYIAIEEHIGEDGTIQEFDNNFTLMSPVICEALAVKEDRRIRTKVPQTSSYSNLAANSMDVDAEDEIASKPFLASEIVPSSSQVSESSGARLLHLRGHQADVHNFAWNPNHKQLATAAVDGVARLWGLWEMSADKWDAVNTELSIKTSLLPHKLNNSQKLNEVTFVSWNTDGTLLATACNDGNGRVWDQQGAFSLLLQGGHDGMMLSIKWSKNSQYLVSRGSDGLAVVWSAADGKIVKSFAPHADSGSEVDWKDSDIFATCGGFDLVIAISSVSSGDNPIKKFSGHNQEVNCVVWSPAGDYLASVSDDRSAKIWTLEDGLKHDLRGHRAGILIAKWTPTGPGTNYPDSPLLLCTGSIDGDGSVKVWDPITAQLVFNLSKYATATCSIAISPEGKYLASGTLNGRVIVWNLSTGELVQEIRVGTQDNYEVGWSYDGSLLSAAFVQGALVVIEADDFLQNNNGGKSNNLTSSTNTATMVSSS